MRKFQLLSCLAVIVLSLSACKESPSNGADGLNMLIDVRVATESECKYGGTAFVQGFDTTGDGKVDNIVSTTLNCNPATAPVIAKIEPCGPCHQAENDALVPSPHLQRAFLNSYASYVSDQCLSCHTGGLNPSIADYKSLNATSGLVCKSCHTESTTNGFGTIHKTVGVNTLLENAFVRETMCSNVGCHGNSGHVDYGHPYPFAENISAAFKKDTYQENGTTAPDATRFNVHGKTTGRNTCTPCHAGGYFEVVVTGNASLERRATGTVVDGKTIWTSTGGASYYIEYQREKMFGSSDVKTGFNYFASTRGFGTFDNGTLKVDTVASNINCTACHDKHSTELVGKEVKDVDGTVVFSKEFMTCTSCHIINLDAVKNDNGMGYKYKLTAKYAPDPSTLVDTSVGQTGDGPFKVPTLKSEDLGHHANAFVGDKARNIGKTHFSGQAYDNYTVGRDKLDNITVSKAVKDKGILQFTSDYNINAGSANSCTSCHDAHYSTKFAKDGDATAVNVIANNWAKSKHAAYDNNAMVGRTTGYSSSCNRCHNGIAFAYSIGGVAPAKLNQEAFKVTGSVMAQTISCVACHDNSLGETPALTLGFNDLKLSTDNDTTAIASGRIRQWKSKRAVLTEIDPAWVQDNITRKTLADGTNVDLTVLATAKIKTDQFGEKSMVCTNCHSGRNTGERIVESVHANGPYALGTPTTSRALTDYAHYMDIIGTINKNGPYNFAGREYAKTLDNSHQQRASVSCVTCHDVKAHTFKVFKDADGNPIYSTNPDAIKGYTATCSFNCHGNAVQSVTAKKGYDDALIQLKSQLASRGKYYNANGATVTGIRYASFWSTAPDGTTAVESWSSIEELGAAYNTLYFAKYDVAGWAHGMKYTRQILWDSMEMLGGSFSGDAAVWIGSTRP